MESIRIGGYLQRANGQRQSRNLSLRNIGGYANAQNLLMNRQEQAYLLKLHQKTMKAATVLDPQPQRKRVEMVARPYDNCTR
jgi:hypothetical protein